MTILRFICVIAWYKYFIPICIPINCVNIPQFIYPFTLYGHRGCTQIGAVMNKVVMYISWVSQEALVVKNLPANTGECKRHGIDPWVRKIPWRRTWQPTPVFLPRESHGHRSLAGYGP